MGSNLFSSMIITLREGIEAALAVGIVFLYLKKTGRRNMASALWWGLAIAVAASIGGAVLIKRIAFNSEVFEGVTMFIAAVFVGTMIVWMWSSAKGLKKEIESKIEEIAPVRSEAEKGASIGLFIFTFMMIFREGIETVIFLSAVNLTTDALLSFIGGVVGLLIAVVFGILFVRGSIRIDLGRFFKITGIVLLLFVIQLLIGGVHELGEGGAINVGPRAMAIIGPIVKNNALFLIGVLLIPGLMLVVPGRKQSLPETSSQAEKRLLLHQQRKQQLWRTSAAALSLCIVLFIAYDFVYGSQTQKRSAAIPVSAEHGMIRIPVSQVSDGNLHRFVLSGTPIRFIVLQDEQGVIAMAFDACEICGSQGYVQDGKNLVCLNCSADINTATLSRGGGCNPVPLLSRQQGDELLIQVQDLQAERHRFE